MSPATWILLPVLTLFAPPAVPGTDPSPEPSREQRWTQVRAAIDTGRLVETLPELKALAEGHDRVADRARRQLSWARDHTDTGALGRFAAPGVGLRTGEPAGDLRPEVLYREATISGDPETISALGEHPGWRWVADRMRARKAFSKGDYLRAWRISDAAGDTAGAKRALWQLTKRVVLLGTLGLLLLLSGWWWWRRRRRLRR